MPAFPIQSLATPPAANVQITRPIPPDGGTSMKIPRAEGLAIEWVVPAGTLPGQSLLVFAQLAGVVTSAPRTDLRCAYPLSQGKATIPAELFAEIAKRMGTEASGSVNLWSGSMKEVSIGGASYAILVWRSTSASTVSFSWK